MNISVFSAFLISLIWRCKGTSSSILFSSMTWQTLCSEKPVAVSSLLTYLRWNEFCFLHCQLKYSCKLQRIILEVFLTCFLYSIVNFNYRCRTINTATLSQTVLPRYAGIHTRYMQVHAHMRHHKHVMILHSNDAIRLLLTSATPELEQTIVTILLSGLCHIAIAQYSIVTQLLYHITSVLINMIEFCGNYSCRIRLQVTCELLNSVNVNLGKLRPNTYMSYIV